jgi:hypothetical protein
MRNNRVYKGIGFRYIYRKSLFFVAIAVDGQIMTPWCQSFSDCKAAFIESINDINEG